VGLVFDLLVSSFEIVPIFFSPFSLIAGIVLCIITLIEFKQTPEVEQNSRYQMEKDK
jgi:uncharacterized protein YacL